MRYPDFAQRCQLFDFCLTSFTISDKQQECDVPVLSGPSTVQHQSQQQQHQLQQGQSSVSGGGSLVSTSAGVQPTSAASLTVTPLPGGSTNASSATPSSKTASSMSKISGILPAKIPGSTGDSIGASATLIPETEDDVPRFGVTPASEGDLEQVCNKSIVYLCI